VISFIEGSALEIVRQGINRSPATTRRRWPASSARSVIEAYNFLRSIAEGRPYGSTLADAVRSAAALDAMSESAATGQWVTLS